MKLINIQGLTKSKLLELNDLLDENTILFLTETQQRSNKLFADSSYSQLSSMRDIKDERGGGLAIIYDQQNFIIEHVKCKHKDMLIVTTKFKGQKATIILVFFSIIRGEEEQQENQDIIRKIKEFTSSNFEDELIFIMGDFNAHIGIIGEQQINWNGKEIPDLMSEDNLILMNDTDKCNGLYTWSRGEQKSVIDFILVNKKAYQICKYTKIDEQQDLFD
eukprot:gene17185-18915_t